MTEWISVKDRLPDSDEKSIKFYFERVKDNDTDDRRK